MNKKDIQLGMPYGTANNKLKKNLLFSLIKEAKKNICYRCNNLIEDSNSLSIEHKIPFLDSENPIEVFFDLDNIAFSHLSCNCSNTTRVYKKVNHSYRNGCRCNECKESQRLRLSNYRKTK